MARIAGQVQAFDRDCQPKHPGPSRAVRAGPRARLTSATRAHRPALSFTV
jgi:hypothetical protein